MSNDTRRASTRRSSPAIASRWLITVRRISSGESTIASPRSRSPAGAQESADVRVVRELRDLFAALKHADDVNVVVVTGAGGNFCSGGDVHEIIGPLVALKRRSF
jgi:hypothetical protein